MWKLVGLLALAALFVDTNASVLNIGPECPTLSHDDQFYYILDASEPSISVTLTPWEGLEGFDVGDLECNVDYSAGATLTLVAGPCIITCSVSGCDEEFKYTITVIDKSSCNVPAEVSNGQVNGASTVVPVSTEVTVSCNTNYAPSGGPGVCTRSEVFAENQGGSTEVGTDEPSVVGLAECNAITCDSPPSVQDASLDSSLPYAIGDTVTYSCNSGFSPQGDLTSSCSLDAEQNTASFSSVTGSCVAITCDNPHYVQDASIDSLATNAINDVVTYTCNSGFSPQGVLSSTCSLDAEQNTASYSSVTGSCVAITCDSLPTVLDASLVSSLPYAIYDVVTYTCNSGFSSQGDLTSTCSLDAEQNTASFSSVTGSCVAITCESPPSVQDASLDSSPPYAIGGTVTYSCNSGFSPQGDLTSSCSLDAEQNTASFSSVTGSCVEPALTQRQEKPVCPEGFTFLADRETGQCVKYQPDNLPWEMHARRCKRSGGRLVVPVSAADLKAVLVYQATQTKEVVWYGPQAVAGDGVFRDLDQRPLIYNNFGESGDGNCAYVQSDGGLYVKDCCWNLRPAMCAIDLPGPRECNEVGGYELSNGRCYRLIDNEGSFEEQCRSCHRLNGQLAPALDEKQNEALTNFFLSKLPDGDNFEAWIGMHNMVDENSLQSVDLRSSSFTAFAPSTDSASGRCVTVGREGWGKKCCFDRLRAVCELNLCDKGYVQVGNNCYKVVGSTNPGSTWEDNCRTCHRDGASLVSFSQASDVSDFLGYIGDTAGRYVGGSDLWIGCHDQATEGAFQTSSLQEFLFFGGVSRPSKNADAEDCCVLNEHGVSATCCYSCLRGVCSKPLNK